MNALVRRRQLRASRSLILGLLGLVLTLLAPAGAGAKPPAADFWGLQTAGMLGNPSYAPDETAAMKALGIHTVRMSIPWSLVQQGNGVCGGGPAEGKAGERNWSTLDAIFLKAAEDGITVHANLGARRNSGCGHNGYQTAPSQEYSEWIDPVNGFARALINRYGIGGVFWNEHSSLASHAVKVWEVGNEENYSVFAPNSSPNPTGYAKYLVDTAIALRSGDPNATVLIGGLAPGGWAGTIAPTTFIGQMYAGAGSGGYTAEELDWAYNGVAIHPYSLTNHHGYKTGSNYGEHAEEVVANTWAIRNYLNSNGDANKTLWVTEVGWPVGTFTFGATTFVEDPTQQARDLWETLGLLSIEADNLKLQYVGWYLFEDRACTTCGWDDKAGLREYGGTHPIRYSWCAYSHLTGSYYCPFVPKEGFLTQTTMSEPKTQNGQPGSVSFTGTVNVINIPGEPVTNLIAEVKFFKQNSAGEYVLKSTDKPTVINGQFAVTNRPVGVGNWKVQTVFPQQGNFKKSETGLHPFTIKATSLCATETFLTPGTTINGQPGFITLSGTVNVPNPDCGEVNGQYLNVNFYKKNNRGEYILDSTDHPVVSGGSWSEVNRPVGTGSWKVKAVFPQQDWFNTSSSGEHPFSIAVNGWHIDNLGGTFTADPDISSQGSGRLDIFGRGAENSLWIKSLSSGTWGNWVYMGGALASGPGAVSWSSGRIDVVMRDGSNNVSHWFWGGSWAADNLGGPISSDVDISSWGVNRLDVFARGTNNHLLHKYWGGAGWSGWEDMGGNLAGGPGAVSWGSGRIDVVARMSDNTIGHWYWAGAGWAYDNLGGTLTSDPDIASQGAGKLNVFARGTDNGLWHKWYTTSYGNWSNWEPMGNTITSGPGAVSWGNGRVDVVARGANNSLEHWWFQ